MLSVSLTKVISDSVCYLNRTRLSHLNVNKVLPPETLVVSVYACSRKEINRLKKFILCIHHFHASPHLRRKVRANLPGQTQANEEGRNQSQQTFKLWQFSTSFRVVLLEMPMMHFHSYKSWEPGQSSLLFSCLTLFYWWVSSCLKMSLKSIQWVIIARIFPPEQKKYGLTQR